MVSIGSLFFSIIVLNLRNMSCCGGNCGCGADWCGNGCGGCKMYPYLGYGGSTTSETLIIGVALQKTFYEGAGEVAAAENGGCKCGPDCKCNPCNCGK